MIIKKTTKKYNISGCTNWFIDNRRLLQFIQPANKLVFLIILMLFSTLMYAQQNEPNRKEYLYELSKDIPALDVPITISVTNATLDEFLRAIANNSGLNINVQPGINLKVINNFKDVLVKDILLFLLDEYDLEISNIGNIFTIYKESKVLLRNVNEFVRYDSLNNFITLDYNDELLSQVVRDIIKTTGKNIILSPGMDQKRVAGYIQNMPVNPAIEKFAYANNLEVKFTDDDFILFEEKPKEVQETQQQVARPVSPRDRLRAQQTQMNDNQLKIETIRGDSIYIVADNVPMDKLIMEVGDKLERSYYINTNMEELVSLKLTIKGFEDLLKPLLTPTTYTYLLEDNLFVIGTRQTKEYITSKVFSFQYRTVDKITEILPADLKADIEIIEFPDINSLLLTGVPLRIKQLESFLIQIDKIVPVVQIEVIIMDVNKSHTISTGIDFGLSDETVETKGKIFPGPDVQISSYEINKILQNIDRFSSQNIGVQPNVYLALKALENNGVLQVKSTPLLSTLNGNEATLTIGNTEYYLEESSNIIGTQNPQLTTVQTYKPVNAELAITIRPIVSGDDQITLEINVQQSDFTGRISKFAPPGSVSRSFKSTIRVKNQETIVLGGLTESKKNDSASGMPILSRIPVIKWIFSSRTKDKSESMLSIMIKPTIL